MTETNTLFGLMIPFIGTALGAAAVFFMKNELRSGVERALLGFAAGVMIAASVWSLLIPAVEQSSALGRLSFLPAFVGLWLGILFLTTLDRIVARLYRKINDKKDAKDKPLRTVMTVLAVTLHNIPEGMAVGVVYAGIAAGAGDISFSGALALALGIAIQNIPEGAIISMPLCAGGKSKPKAFACGVLSGAVEPIFGALTLLCAGLIVPAMPYLLSFAAGTMVYVVVKELIPGMSDGDRSHIGVLFFAVGFTLMMAPDIALG